MRYNKSESKSFDVTCDIEFSLFVELETCIKRSSWKPGAHRIVQIRTIFKEGGYYAPELISISSTSCQSAQEHH